MRKFKISKSDEERIIFQLVDQYDECYISLRPKRDMWDWGTFFYYDLKNDKLKKMVHQARFDEFEDLIKYFDECVGQNNLKEFKDKANAAVVALEV